MSREQLADIARTKSVITSAQDAALSRHILADDFAGLSAELVSSYEHGIGQATLLEDLEVLHRQVKELENVQHYVRVIERALKLRYGLLLVIECAYGTPTAQLQYKNSKTLAVRSK